MSFAGKSTVAQGLAPLIPAEVVSLDSINAERGLVGGDGIPVEEWIATNGIARERVSKLLASGASTIVDDTTSLRMLRDGWRSLASEHGARTALVWVQIDAGLQRERLLANRLTGMRDDVIDEVITQHVASFESPASDELPLILVAGESRNPERIAALVAAILEG